MITKGILFDYVSHHNLTGAANTKTELIERILGMWRDKYNRQLSIESTQRRKSPNLVINVVNNHTVTNILHQEVTSVAATPDPLQLLSEEFSTWLCQRINSKSLVPTDLWPDVTSAIRLIDNHGNQQEFSSEGAADVLKSFNQIPNNFNFQLAPNTCQSGVQGRMNTYGMVMIACCGTVYQSNVFVGIFEAGFGLLRDPQSTDTWKLKHSKLQIKSASGNAGHPKLTDCDTLFEILALPAPETDESKAALTIKQNS